MARPTGRTKDTPAQRTPAPAASRPLRGRVVGISVVVLLAAAVAAFVYFDPPPPGTEFPSLGNQHIASVAEPHIPYNSSPPSSGPHLGALARWGVAEEPVPPELFVHNLEDGGIVIAYDCPDGCPEFVDGLGEFAQGHVLVTPYEGIQDPEAQSHRGAAVGWTRVLYFDELDADTASDIRTFIGLYEGVDHHVR